MSNTAYVIAGARERRTATHSPTGAVNATACTSSAGARTCLRASGAAVPAATTPQAAARIALDRRTPWRFLPGNAPGGLLGRRHERADHRAALVGLRMPLHAQHEARAGQLDRLGQAVHRRGAADLESLAQAVYALVVVGLGGVRRLADHARRQRAVAQLHVVVGAVEGSHHAPVLVVAEA